MLTDSHAHLTSTMVGDQLKEMLQRAKEAGVTRIVNICTEEESLVKGLELAKREPWIYNTAATTPHDVDKDGENFFPLVEKHAKAGDLIGIGESGLDYFYEHSNRKTQQEFLVRYCALAKETKLPLVIHCREAFADLFALADLPSAVLHCFTGTLEEAKQVIDRNWFLSFSGIITFKKSESLREAVKFAPLESILIETDTPYLAPQSKRGKTNEPSYIVETAQMIATCKGISLEEVTKQTAKNASQFFSFSKRP